MIVRPQRILPRPGRRLDRLAASLLLALALSATAQTLPADAASALARAQRLAAEAQITYDVAVPDRPLWAEALAAGREAAEAAPEHLAPQRFLAQAYYQVGWYARSWESWLRYVELGGALDAVATRQFVEVARWMGASAYDTGRLDDAVPFFEAILNRDPTDLMANERLARTYLVRGEALRALPYLEALAGRVPDLFDDLEVARRVARFGADAAAAYAAGQAAADPATALARYGEAVALAPGFVDAWRGAAAAALALDLREAAAAAMSRVVELDPDDVRARADLEALTRTTGEDAAARVAEEAAAREQAEAAARAAAEARAAAAREAEAAAEARAAAEAQAEADAEAAAAAVAEGQTPPDSPSDAQTEIEAAAAAQAEAEAARIAAAEAEAARLAAEAERAARAEAEARAAADAEAARRAAEAEAARIAAETAAAARAEADARAARDAAARAETEARVAAAAARAALGPVVLADAELVHRPAGAQSAAVAFAPNPDLGRDLADFLGDRVTVEVELRSKPGAEPVLYQLCLVPPDVLVTPACSAIDLLVLRTAGTYTATVRWSDLSGAAEIDWSRGVDAVMWVLRRADGTPVDADAADAANYLPMSLRVRAVASP